MQAEAVSGRRFYYFFFMIFHGKGESFEWLRSGTSLDVGAQGAAPPRDIRIDKIVKSE